LDLALLDALAARHPEWTLVMLGDVYEQGCAEALARLRSRPNAHLLPSVAGDQVPAYVRAFDLGLVPYRLTDETHHASPLKVYEYLAAGAPVVAADVPGARQFASSLTLARSLQEWEAGITAELACDDAARRAKRREAVAPHTWDARVETLSKHLAEALEAKCASR
jgi:glycosyltransferase involved in cell wall biosynthesis